MLGLTLARLTSGAPLDLADAPATRVRPPPQSYEERRREFIATTGRGFVVKGAIGFSAATVICVSVVLLPFAPLCGFAAFSSWWEVRRRELYEPPTWLKTLGRGVMRALTRNIGR